MRLKKRCNILTNLHLISPKGYRKSCKKKALVGGLLNNLFWIYFTPYIIFFKIGETAKAIAAIIKDKIPI
jgi:hypothetical protein